MIFTLDKLSHMNDNYNDDLLYPEIDLTYHAVVKFNTASLYNFGKLYQKETLLLSYTGNNIVMGDSQLQIVGEIIKNIDENISHVLSSKHIKALASNSTICAEHIIFYVSKDRNVVVKLDIGNLDTMTSD